MATQTIEPSAVIDDFLLRCEKNGRKIYVDKMAEMVVKMKSSIVVDFQDIETFDTDLAVDILKDPERTLKSFRDVVINNIWTQNPEFGKSLRTKTVVRISNLDDVTPIREVNVSLMGKLFAVAGAVTKVSERKNIATVAAFQCANGHISVIIQEGEEFRKPDRCESAGCTDKVFIFDRERSIFADYQKIRIQELGDDLPAGQIPRGYDVAMLDDLIDTVRPGDHVVITGMLKAVHEKSLTSSKNRVFASEIECNYAEVRDKNAESSQITKDDIIEIKKLAASPDAYTKLVTSVAPAILGYEHIKEAVLLQLAGGVSMAFPDGTKRRGDIHVMLIGEPGVAKSEVLQFASKVAPRSVMASGKSSSAAGLSAAIVKGPNDLMYLEVGVLPMADQGLAIVDEFDKIRNEDKSALHEGMEQQCYDDKTEVLTEDGWKLFKDLESTDRVATLKDEGLVYVLPTNYITTEYSGDVYRVKSSQVDLLVTPNHNMYVNINRRANEWEGFGLIRMDKLPAKRMRFKKNAVWAGMEKENFEIPGINKGLNQNGSIQTKPILVSMDTWLEFLGYYLAEGSYGKQNDVPYRTILTQSGLVNPDVKQKMRDCIDNMGMKFLENGNNLIICSKQLASFMTQFGHCHDKFIPQEIKQLCSRQLRIIFDALVSGDGTISSTGHTTYMTSSKRLADDFQEICLKIGLAANISITIKKGESVNLPNGRMGAATADIFAVSVISESHCLPNINHSGRYTHIRKEKYVGKIYCVEVPTHLLYVRRNGIPIWCGNTVTINKAGFHMSLNTRTSVLAALNPQGGLYDSNLTLMENIKVPAPLVSRFDLITVILDRPTPEGDRAIANHIMSEHMKESYETAPPIPLAFLKKYLTYVRLNIRPRLVSGKASDAIVNYYSELRRQSEPGKPPVTARALESLIRLATARAKILIHEEVTEDDANVAIALMRRMLKEIFTDAKTGELNTGELIGISNKDGQATIAQKVIRELSTTSASGQMERRDIKDRMLKAGLDEEKAEKMIKWLIYEGRMFEVKAGYFKAISQ